MNESHIEKKERDRDKRSNDDYRSLPFVSTMFFMQMAAL